MKEYKDIQETSVERDGLPRTVQDYGRSYPFMMSHIDGLRDKLRDELTYIPALSRGGDAIVECRLRWAAMGVW